MASKRDRAQSERSKVEWPVVRISATARATPAEWVTQTASARRKVGREGEDPISGPPSGVKEKRPLKPSDTEQVFREGRRFWDSVHAGEKSSAVKARREGMFFSSTSFGVAPRDEAVTGIGRWP